MMVIIYPEKLLGEMHHDFISLEKRKVELMGNYCSRQYKGERGMEHARYGFSRRIDTMVHCIDQVFEKLSPEKTDASEPILKDVMVYIQAFVFNTYGCVDNLAHIWVSEKEIKQNNEDELPLGRVGFDKNCAEVVKSLPFDFKNYLSEIEPWRIYMGNFRNALAHRIPLYVPPYCVPRDQKERHKQLEIRIHEAKQRKNYNEVEILENEKNKLQFFLPVMAHSFMEQSIPVYFHYQMLMDFGMIEKLAMKMLNELNSD